MGQPNADRPYFFKSVRNYFREYCVCSSIHGFRYFGERRTYFERVWWFFVFGITFAACAIAIREVYQKWIRSPVIVSFATRETPIYSIPFPAVTICPESKSSHALYNHTKMMRKFIEHQELTPEEQAMVDYMGLVCDVNPLIFCSKNETFSEDVYKVLDEVKVEFPLSGCEFMGVFYDCKEIFKPTITDEGICYTFNMLDRTEIYNDNVKHNFDFNKARDTTNGTWSMLNGYVEEAGLFPYPRRALLAGARNSLSVFLSVKKDDIDQICKRSLHGYRVTLHMPLRIPRPSQQYFRVPINEVVMAAIKPDMITTSASVQLYNPKRRECYFPQEKSLKYFKIYSSVNCQLECLANYTLYYCGCMNFFMPRDNLTPICGIGSQKCARRAEYRLLLGDLRKKLNKPSDGNRTKHFNGQLSDCSCLPMCSDIAYHVETSQSFWDWEESLKATRLKDDGNMDKSRYHLSKLMLFFKDSQFKSSQRHELYGPTDFLANFGGLLGLFTGFSVLSLMEVIYFLTVRLCCNTRLYGYWAGPQK